MSGTITVDEALQKLGGFGLFQWLIYIGANITEMAVTYQIFLLTFIAAEPKWVCKNESLVCNFTEPIGLTDDDYNKRCDMPRSEWKFADDFTSIVTEVCLARFLFRSGYSYRNRTRSLVCYSYCNGNISCNCWRNIRFFSLSII